MNYWIISDTHFNHRKLDEWGRPSGWEDMLWEGLSRIPAGDVLIHLGDVNIGNDQQEHLKLKSVGGHYSRILVRGNHDKKSFTWYRGSGWDFVCDGLDLKWMGKKLRFTHIPETRLAGYDFNIHGHTHGNNHRTDEFGHYWDTAYHLDISPELVGYRPLRLDSFLKTKQ